MPMTRKVDIDPFLDGGRTRAHDQNAIGQLHRLPGAYYYVEAAVTTYIVNGNTRRIAFNLFL